MIDVAQAILLRGLRGNSAIALKRRRHAIGTTIYFLALGCGLALVLAVVGTVRGTGRTWTANLRDASEEARWIDATMPAPFAREARSLGATRWIIGDSLVSRGFAAIEEMLTLTPVDEHGGIVDESLGLGVYRMRVGWPWPALEMSNWNNQSFGGIESGMWRWPNAMLGLPGLPVGVRLVPLLGDTIVIGVVCWLIARVPFATRAELRERRGECGCCGHTLAGSAVCPECGASSGASSRIL